jgi:hypothetical protein
MITMTLVTILTTLCENRSIKTSNLSMRKVMTIEAMESDSALGASAKVELASTWLDKFPTHNDNLTLTVTPIGVLISQ